MWSFGRSVCIHVLSCWRLCPPTAGSSPSPESSNVFCSLLSLPMSFPVAHNVISQTTFRYIPNGLTPFIFYSVLLMVHLLSFIRAMFPAHFHFSFVTCSAVSVTLVLCLTKVSAITPRINLFIASTSPARLKSCRVSTRMGWPCVGVLLLG